MYILLGNRSSEGDGEVNESKFSIFSLMKSLFEYGALSVYQHDTSARRTKFLMFESRSFSAMKSASIYF